jgi:hypothetical protein
MHLSLIPILFDKVDIARFANNHRTNISAEVSKFKSLPFHVKY